MKLTDLLILSFVMLCLGGIVLLAVDAAGGYRVLKQHQALTFGVKAP